MPSDSVMHRYLRCAYHLETGFIIPDDFCSTCADQLFYYFSAQPLEELLAEPHHVCLHALTAITLLHGVVNGDADLLAALSEEIGTNGWNVPDFLTDDAGDSPTIH